ncbi:TetR/AcrR family transcriptional regulator [Actinomycetospora sp. NBRC 106378]|uniref:TetR/AcrR family transcriptional regulator n=1 Tax=Actinomycetospora sp. NBRC 106378 TaxID=3032208 RepID=UPI0024A37595|nr:TetR/AcrR family transcriptional regulator [Actinomycetospora sp. NBRC 106378]GLZ56386.1 TetR family transcriptional regulator [Actinomycetospora sp. NBRC 106378]
MTGLRERKKAETRHRIADVAAHLFAEHGFDDVTMTDVAGAADVAEQTVYNYFPAKTDLVLDRAEEIRQRLHDLVLHRSADTSPAQALQVVALEDIERARTDDLAEQRGQFFALCVSSHVVRRFGLEVRDEQVAMVRAALAFTDPALNPGLAHVHAAALVAVLHLVGDTIGGAVVRGDFPPDVGEPLEETARLAFSDLDAHYRRLVQAAS